ncbi:MAG: AbrB/MazE/SpoVT family DNA-binding domain-containing protein [Lachnotalea sp.]
MKKTGIIRKCDDLGRIVIPKEIRKTFEIQEGEPIEIFVQDDAIVLKKYIPSYDVKTKIQNAISSIQELSEYKGSEAQDMKKIEDYLGLAMLEFEKLDTDTKI